MCSTRVQGSVSFPHERNMSGTVNQRDIESCLVRRERDFGRRGVWKQGTLQREDDEGPQYEEPDCGRYEKGTRKAGSYSRVFVWVCVVGRVRRLVLLHVLILGLGPQRSHRPLLHGLETS